MLDTKFKIRVLSMVRRIPFGRVATYGDIAWAAGKPRAARAVGNIMSGCEDSSVPCHRVVAANGRLGGFGRDTQLKRGLLLAEGVIVSRGIVRHFKEIRWKKSAR